MPCLFYKAIFVLKWQNVFELNIPTPTFKSYGNTLENVLQFFLKIRIFENFQRLVR